MTSRDSDEPIDVDGMDLDDAVDVLTRRGDREPETVRRRLRQLAGDGVVSRDSLEQMAESVSITVSMTTSRANVVERVLADAEEAAAGVDDVAIVAARLDEFESRLADLRDRNDRLRERLDDARETVDEGDIDEGVAALERVEADATDVQNVADTLQRDVNDFTEWLERPDARHRACELDLDALADSLDALGDQCDSIAQAPADDAADGDDVAVAWVDAVMRTRAIELFLADVRAELDAFRTLAERDDADADVAADLAERADELVERRAALADRLDDLARSDWRARFGDDLDALSAELDGFAPPVDWDDAGETLDEYRSRVGALE